MPMLQSLVSLLIFYARDAGRIRRVAEGIEAGMVGVNTGLISNATAPFWWGQSVRYGP